MAALMRSLGDDWQLTHNTEAKRLFVSNSAGRQLTIDESLATGSEMQSELELLVIDMFRNEPDPTDESVSDNPA